MSQTSSNASLSASVTSLRSSLALLDSSISILDAGINDFPRLKTVLTTTRHFELVPQSTLVSAQQSLHSELGPAITSLLTRVQTHLAKLERREQALMARAELQDGRLSQGARNEGETGRKRSIGGTGKPPTVGQSSAQNREMADRLRSLRLKKERLAYTVERLTLQSQQRQRQLRQSIAHT